MRIWKNLRILVLILAGMLLFSGRVNAAVKEVDFEAGESVRKYDVTGDGKKDEVVVRCEKPDDEDDLSWGRKWTIHINGKKVFSSNMHGRLFVTMYKVNARRIYFCLDSQSANSPDQDVLYQVSGGKLKKVCDLKESVKIKDSWRISARIDRMTSDKMILNFGCDFHTVGTLNWTMTYRYKHGKWQRSKTFAFVKNNYSWNASKLWTASTKIVTYKSAGGKTKAFTLRKGEKVKLKTLCVKNKKIYFQVVKSNGKKGWFQESATSETLFDEAVLLM